uniref:SFRICE_014060 n=1 Tax=Spodoptera frugiperda TaxID=7108 RepID=A0A2H1V8L8_SPOFR
MKLNKSVEIYSGGRIHCLTEWVYVRTSLKVTDAAALSEHRPTPWSVPPLFDNIIHSSEGQTTAVPLIISLVQTRFADSINGAMNGVIRYRAGVRGGGDGAMAQGDKLGERAKV